MGFSRVMHPHAGISRFRRRPVPENNIRRKMLIMNPLIRRSTIPQVKIVYFVVPVPLSLRLIEGKITDLGVFEIADRDPGQGRIADWRPSI